MEFQPRVQDFYVDDAVPTNPVDGRKKILSKVKRVGNVWVIPDGESFEKEHKAYKALNEQSREMEYLYVDPTLKIDQFFDLDIPRYISPQYRFLKPDDVGNPPHPRRRSFKQHK